MLWLFTQLPQPALAQVFQTAAPRRDSQQTIPPPQPADILEPTPETKLPILTLDLYTDPPTVTVGMTTTIQITLDNRSRNPATGLSIQLPLPPGVKLIDQTQPVIAAIPELTQPAIVVPPIGDQSLPALAPEPPAGSAAIPLNDPTVTGGQPVAPPAIPTVGDEGPQGFYPQQVPVLDADHSQDRPALTITDPPLGLGPYVGPRFAPGRDPEWRIEQLPAQSTLMVRAIVQVLAPQKDGAVLFAPVVSAAELSTSISLVRGTFVLDTDKQDDRGSFAPGRAVSLQSRDGRVRIHVPDHAKQQAMQLRITNARDVADEYAQVGKFVPRGSSFGQASFEPIILQARDDQGAEITQFDQPITLEVAYTEAQLRARGLHEGLLTLAFFDEQQQRWVAVPTSIDYTNHIARAAVSHFSAWELQNGSNPSLLYVPSLQGFQVSDFTGAASYRIPIALPRGAAGHGPTMELSYSSAATDGTSGMRANAQAGWVGKGWNLSVGGSVARVRSPIGEAWDSYTFSFGGKSYDIVRGTQLSGPHDGSDEQMKPSNWAWVSVDEGDFLHIRAVDRVTNPNAFDWVVWTKDGTRYEFRQALYSIESIPLKTTPPTETDREYIYQWLLNRVVDAHGNHIEYKYDVQASQLGSIVTHPTYYLQEILWGYDTMGTDGNGSPLAGGTPRYRVSFVVRDKNTTGVDSNWEYQTQTALGTPVGERFKASTPHERWQLDSIQIQTMRAGLSAHELMSQYNLSYYTPTLSIRGDIIPDTSTQRQLTLAGVQRLDKNGVVGTMPKTLFSYNYLVPGANPYLAPDYNRLTEIDNGQGGKIVISYANTFEGTGLVTPPYANYKRVTQILRQDTSNQTYSRSYLSTYSYVTPAVNSTENSAKIWYAQYPPYGNTDSTSQLSHQPLSEFRGHHTVTVREYNGSTIDAAQLLRATETRYYQGLAFNPVPTPEDPHAGSWTCTPVLVNNKVNVTDGCWERMLDSELWKGRPQYIKVFNNAGALMKRTWYTYDHNPLADMLPFFGTLQQTFMPSGLWPFFTPTRVVEEGYTETYPNPLYGKTTVYCYAPDWTQGWAQYGNQTHVIEYDQLVSVNLATQIDDPPDQYAAHCDSPATAVTPIRITRTAYVTPTLTIAPYFASLPAQTAVFGANVTQLLANTEYFYDDDTHYGTVGTRGRLTLQRAYRNMTEVPMRSVDTHYIYDVWGNRTTTSTYPDWGTRTYPSYSLPGNGSSPRSTKLDFDPIFNTFPMTVTNALGQIERADYDFRMGTLTKLGGPNVADASTFKNFTCSSSNAAMEITCASYDSFGRLATIVRPGDTTGSPTLTASYDDNAKPFRYTYSQKVTAATGTTTQEFVQFYDGLGRKIQEKRELSGSTMAVTHTRYDALGRIMASSQPQSTTATWNAYVPEPAAATPLYRQTSTTYDGLDRVRYVTAPDGSQQRTDYGAGAYGLQYVRYDAKNHITTYDQDVLGRLRKVWESSGNAGSEGVYAPYAQTVYSYDGLDRLRNVVDKLNNVTVLDYDALGRKTSMSDPDMGSWSYSYDVNGTLHTQTDARNIITTFSYDVLDRLTGKSFSAFGDARSYTYDEAAAGNGKGQRTSSCAFTGASCTMAQSWIYDGRGRQTSTTQTLNGTALTMAMSYDSADRLRTQTYPGGEVVTTSYDVAGRALSLCSSLGGCYVDNSTNTSVYTELDQPVTRKLGNGLTTTWSYTTPLAQLERITTPGVFDRKYSYDPVGNVSAIRNFTDNQTQNLSYDHRDRLTRAWTVVGTAQAPSMLLRQAMGPAAPAMQDASSAQARIQAMLVRDLSSLGDDTPPAKVPHGYARLPQSRTQPAPQAQTASTLAQDSFTRTVSNGWGTATTGGSYGAPSSNATDYSVNGSVGRMTVATVSTSRELMWTGTGTRSARDVDITVRIATSALPATSGEMRFILLARRVDGNNDYQGSVRLLPSGQVRLEARRNVNGTETTLGSSVTVSGLTASATNFLRVRMQVTGINLTTINLRVWADGTSEPTTWQVTRTDSTTILQQAGAVGMRTQLTTGATNAPVTGSWDDWQVLIQASDPVQDTASVPSYDDSFSYDVLGNLTNKDGVVQQYGANGNGTGARPHAATSVGGAAYSYDATGNLLTGGGRSLTWNAENQPTQVLVSGGVTEQYSYDADGNRVTRSATPGLTTRYAFGLYEVEGAITRKYYTMGGQVIAARDSSLGLSYLYGDHLGSISVSTNSVGQRLGVQYFDAWGKKLTGSVSQTKRGYTGQYLDDTGLLFYNARYYDPGIGRFVSADSIAPQRENPQTRNRYSYVINNPLTFTDPTGHCNVRGNDGDDLNECKARLADLSQYGITIVDFSSGLWSLLELVAFVQGALDLRNAMHWSMDEFRNSIGAVHASQSLENLGKALVGTNASALSTPSGKGYTDMVFYQDSINGVDKGDKTFFLKTVVHELAHAWDFNRGGAMSLGMMSATGSYYDPKKIKMNPDGSINSGYVAVGTTTNYGTTNHSEDWAESVSAYVYDPSLIDSNRRNYVKNPGGGGGGAGGKR